MGILDSLLGNSQADAAKRAASDTFAKKSAAGTALRDYGDSYAGKFAGMAEGYDPFIETGLTGNAALQRLIADPNSIRSTPYYQTGAAEGAKAIDRSAVSRSGIMNGKLIKDQTRFGEDYFEKNYGNEIARLLGISQFGAGATTAANATEGQGLQGQLQTRTSSYAGDVDNASTIGQGDIAAENAKTSALQNLLGTAAYLGGSALGGGGLGKLFGGGSSSYNNPFGGVSNPTFGR